ncbi:MAG TPA: CAP domain-containing protein [Verrucomicrobiae bacterium]|nr:CAP domain-containing protein [Verrucomicrobiae bacterium]
MKQSHKKHPGKKHSSAKKPKRWMRAVGGYSSMAYVGRIVVSLGLIGIGAGLVTLFQPHASLRNPLDSISHTSNAPDTSELLQLVNAARTEIHVPNVTLDPQLTAVAEERLKDMVQHQYYSHQSLKGQYYYDLFAGHGFKTSYSCENLGIAPTLVAKKYVDDWLTSNEGHKDCMLTNRVSKVGIATAEFSKSSNAETTYLVVSIYSTAPTATK